ncbi:protein required for cell viability, putative [Cordyceps militaris CM01]|uniref:Protein required for cell viability, putative n=1 Tax=Cordyceps militaris (strain CM01) TaxID=983644 RepID=G3J2K4_CORMM|nr:protein required for cell viability, putative [Cordyceps militaris CM01]EGX95540.1 protein required for cell viability, putative [Cordyceps militaris CM01]
MPGMTLTKPPARGSWIRIVKRHLSPRVVQTAPLDQPCCQNHSTGSGGEERTSGLRPETLTTRLMASSPLTCLRDGRGNRAVGASQSVAAEVPIISQSNFSAVPTRIPPWSAGHPLLDALNPRQCPAAASSEVLMQARERLRGHPYLHRGVCGRHSLRKMRAGELDHWMEAGLRAANSGLSYSVVVEVEPQNRSHLSWQQRLPPAEEAGSSQARATPATSHTSRLWLSHKDVAKEAFNPASDEVTREAGRLRYDDLVKQVDTWTLLHALNALIKPDVVPPWLRQPLMQTLTLIPLRNDGVRGTLELVFSVHPSNVGAADPSGGQEPQKQGAGITHEAVAVATKLLSSVPVGMTAEYWFSGISAQVFALMDGTAGPDLARTAAQIVGFGILGKKAYGAPGSAGWNVFVQPLLEGVNPSLRQRSPGKKEEEDEIIDLSKPKVLVEADALQEALQRLQVLVLSNPSPGLCKRILGRIILQIWALASWNNPNEAVQNSVYTPARKLLRTYLQLFGNLESVKPLIANLTCKGSSTMPTTSTSIATPWRYTMTTSGAVEITALPPPDASQPPDLDWTDIEYRATTLAEYISGACSAEDTSSIFLSLLRRWVETAGKQSSNADISLFSPVKTESGSPIEDLMEVSILQQLMEKAPDKLISHFDQLLELITQIFEADAKSPLGDEVISVVLSLVNLAVTAPTFQKSDINPKELQVVEQSLDRLSQEDRADVSGTARNLSLLLKYRDELDDDDKGKGPPDSRKVEDRKTYNLAMGYITGDKENPPPIVAEGLKLLSGLIVAESPILDITAVSVLLSNLLAENEDYINLQVVKMFTQLANKHPKTTMKEILDQYLDAQEKATTDTRLRFGEALAHVIERLGQTFTGDIAQQACETLLSIAGRRGHRPKTLARQAREERMRKLKERKKALGDEDADMEDEEEEEELTEQDRADNDILAQIVQGWESKRGSEDVRMRASALSILGAALESHLRGVGPAPASAAVDLCLHVLALEPEPERAILRRAAIITILSFLRALAAARDEGGPASLGFGLTGASAADIRRSLEYVAATDNDGLVREHARDAVESLAVWQATSALLPTAAGDGGGGSLAGLRVSGGRPHQRPRIEEIE